MIDYDSIPSVRARKFRNFRNEERLKRYKWEIFGITTGIPILGLSLIALSGYMGDMEEHKMHESKTQATNIRVENKNRKSLDYKLGGGR